MPRNPENSPRAAAFETLRWWADEAIYRLRAGRSDLPTLKPLRELLPANDSSTSIVHTCVKHYGEGENRRLLVGIKTKRWPEDAKRCRYLLPVHFAIVRALELVPGVSIYLAGDRNRARDLAEGIQRSQEEMIFNLTLKVPKIIDGISRTTKIDRILFNVDSRTSLYARRSGDHHYILPSGSVPIAARIRKKPYCDRRTLRKMIIMQMRAKAKSMSISSIQIDGLLSSLFMISDELHWDELIDRLPRDEAYRSRDDLADVVRRVGLAKHPNCRMVEAILSRRS